MGLDAMILGVWTLSFKPYFSLFSFTFIKRLFRYSSLSAIRVVTSLYLRLLVFLLAILIPACDSSSLTFHMMCSAKKLNKQDDRIQAWCNPFPIWKQSIISCLILTFFLTSIQVSQEAGKVIWYFHLFKNFPQFAVIHIIKGFSIVNEAEVGIFFLIPLSFLWSNIK